jgi:NAD(P)-dependent dehydrogenase (short-subunit alcohol dehydrogenase family)
MSAPARTPPAIVITGASTGIGEACALALDGRGCRVFAGVRSEADAQRLRGRSSPRLTSLHLDVTDAATIAAAARRVDEAVGEAGLAGLVNNAGIVVAGPLELIPLDQLRRQFEVNVIGQVAVTQAFLPLLRRAAGRIVNMGSLNGRIAAPYLAPYAASKHALEAISDALRSELRAWGIEVSLIEPGSIATPIWDKSFAAADQLESETAAEGLALYEADLAAVRKAGRRLADGALPVDRVVRAVVHALFARRPKTRYPVGLQTFLLFRAVKWVPDRLWDRFVRNNMGLREK